MKQLEEIYNRVVEATLEASELTFEQLATSRTERCVIARVVLIDTLIDMGFTESDISLVSGMSQQRVNSLKNSEDYTRRSKEKNEKRVRNKKPHQKNDKGRGFVHKVCQYLLLIPIQIYELYDYLQNGNNHYYIFSVQIDCTEISERFSSKKQATNTNNKRLTIYISIHLQQM